MYWLFCCSLIAVNIALLSSAVEILGRSLTPVVFLPGYGSSKLYLTFEEASFLPQTCLGGNLLPNTKYLIDNDGYNITSVDCVYDLLELNFDQNNGQYSSPTGIAVFSDIEESFGSIDSVYSPYYTTLESWGYKEGLNLFGIPYDYRLISDRSLTKIGFIGNLKGLIEKVYELNGKRRVLLMGHSNGGPTMYSFLQSSSLSRDWRAKYIAGMVGLSGNFLGQMNMIKDFTNHNNQNQQNMTCSWEASVGSITWGGYELIREIPIVTTYFGTTLERNYTASLKDMSALFEESGRSDWAAQLHALYGVIPSTDIRTENTMDRSRHPEVDVYCLYGSSISTSYSFRFAKDAMSAQPIEVLYMEGDDNQEIFDNSFCTEWTKSVAAKNYHFEAKAFPGVHHMEMISNDAVLTEIKRIIELYM